MMKSLAAPRATAVCVLALVSAAAIAGCGTIFDKIGKTFTAFSERLDVRSFDLGSRTWTQRPGLPADNVASTSVVAPSSRLYVVADGPPGGGSDAAYRFDPAAASGAGAWETLPSLPEPRFVASAVVVGSQVCVASGYGAGGVIPYVDILDDSAATPAWTRIPAPSATAEALVIATATSLFLIGGVDETGAVRTDVWELPDVTTTAVATDWVKRGDMGFPRRLSGGFVLGSRIHVIGGDIGDGVALATEDVYDFVAQTLPTASTIAAVPTARFAPQCFVINQQAFVFDPRAPSGLAFTGALDGFSDLGGWTSLARHPVPLTDASGTVLSGQILVAGGRFIDSSSQAYVYDPGSDAWGVLPSMPLNRSGGALATIGDTAYYTGGYEAHEEKLSYSANDFLGL